MFFRRRVNWLRYESISSIPHSLHFHLDLITPPPFFFLSFLPSIPFHQRGSLARFLSPDLAALPTRSEKAERRIAGRRETAGTWANLENVFPQEVHTRRLSWRIVFIRSRVSCQPKLIHLVFHPGKIQSAPLSKIRGSFVQGRRGIVRGEIRRFDFPSVSWWFSFRNEQSSASNIHDTFPPFHRVRLRVRTKIPSICQI